MKYSEFCEQQQKKFSAFPAGAAYSKEQLKEEMKRLGVKSEKELLGIGGGMFIRKADKDAYHELTKELHEEQQAFFADDGNLFDAIVYELANHEYCITYDDTDAIEALGYLKHDERFMTILTQAKKYYLANCDNL